MVAMTDSRHKAPSTLKCSSDIRLRAPTFSNITTSLPTSAGRSGGTRCPQPADARTGCQCQHKGNSPRWPIRANKKAPALNSVRNKVLGLRTV